VKELGQEIAFAIENDAPEYCIRAGINGRQIF
jgi:hypothetical protein